MSVTGIGTSTTDRPARYAKQLTKHMSRRHGGEWNDELMTGWINFEVGKAQLACTESGIVITLTAQNPEDQARLEDVIGRHLEKFGAKDNLVLTWERA